MQSAGTQVMVQHLVEGMTFTLLTMPTVTLLHTQTLGFLTLFQVEYKTGKQSLLGLTISHLMRWRCFILVESQKVAIKFYFLTISIVLYNHISNVNVDSTNPKTLGWNVHVPWL